MCIVYAQVSNEFLILAGCVTEDALSTHQEYLGDDRKTNDHPATAADRGR